MAHYDQAFKQDIHTPESLKRIHRCILNFIKRIPVLQQQKLHTGPSDALKACCVFFLQLAEQAIQRPSFLLGVPATQTISWIMRTFVDLYSSQSSETATQAVLARAWHCFQVQQEHAERNVQKRLQGITIQEESVDHCDISTHTGQQISNSMLKDLPQEILDEIVRQLPSESKRRFKQVSHRTQYTVDSLEAQDTHDWIFPALLTSLHILGLNDQLIFDQLIVFMQHHKVFATVLLHTLAVYGAGGAALDMGEPSEEKVMLVKHMLLHLCVKCLSSSESDIEFVGEEALCTVKLNL